MKVASSCAAAAPRLDMLIVRYRQPSVDSGTLATTATVPRRAPMTLLYYNAIEAYARKQHLPISTVLGYVIAHDVGHVLLGDAHAESGIMRSFWTDDELRRMPSEHLRFGDGERVLLHAKVVSLQTAGRESVILRNPRASPTDVVSRESLGSRMRGSFEIGVLLKGPVLHTTDFSFCRGCDYPVFGADQKSKPGQKTFLPIARFMPVVKAARDRPMQINPEQIKTDILNA